MGVGTSAAGRSRLALLGGFELSCGPASVALPPTAQRVVAFLAIAGRPVSRSQIAGTLWIDATDEHATASLRSALWRLRRPGLALVAAEPTNQLRLADSVVVDYRQALGRVAELLGQSVATDGCADWDECLSRELLPDWTDDWVLLERERFRQRRIYALEARCRWLTEAGRYAGAVDAGLAAIACEPLRETAHRLLIGVHLAEGNHAEALRRYRYYRRLLHDELGLTPSPHLESLMRGALR